MLWLVRHGQSAGNVARDAAEAAGLPLIDIAARDVDVPLSALGERQARALGDWFARLDADARPQVLLCSPYVRAQQTAQRIAMACHDDVLHCVWDERLREKEFGILDRLTIAGRPASSRYWPAWRLCLPHEPWRPPASLPCCH